MMALRQESDQTWYAVGVVSGGDGCAKKDSKCSLNRLIIDLSTYWLIDRPEPGMYMRVMEYLDWIDEVMQSNG